VGGHYAIESKSSASTYDVLQPLLMLAEFINEGLLTRLSVKWEQMLQCSLINIFTIGVSNVSSD
jgi:hypothetical protein